MENKRTKLDFNESWLEQMAEGDTTAKKILNFYLITPEGIDVVMVLDDMNMRGFQIVKAWDFCGKDMTALHEKIMRRDPGMLAFVNNSLAGLYPHKAVTDGTSYMEGLPTFPHPLPEGPGF